jgi:hypothetical protein
MSELKSILNEIDPEVQENSDNSFYNVSSYEYVYDAQSQRVKKKNIMSMFEPGGFYADPTGDRTQTYIKERYIDAPTKATKTIAKEIPLVVSDTLDTIAEEFTDFGDNVLFYTNKYNPVHTLGEYPLPDEKNIFYDQEQGKGNIRSAWDFYRTGNGLIEVQEPETVVGDVSADIGAFLIPWSYGNKIVQTPQMISRGKKFMDRAFRWAVSGAGVEFIYGTESKEDESILGSLTGFSPTGQTGLKTLLHHSFLSGHDADQFANHLDHAINSGIDDGLFSLAFSGLGHMFKSTYFKMFPDELKKSIGKAWQRDHGIAFTKFAERNPGVTNKDTLIKYIKQPNVKKWLEDNSRIFFRSRLNVDDFANKYKVEVMGPVQVGNRAFSNGFDPLSNGYTTYKNNIVKIYKRMLANKNPLMVFLGAGAAYTAMSSSDAEAGILNKTIQKYFEKGGQKLFQRGANNKLVPMTHDDVLAMPVDKEIYIQPQEAEGEWIVHANKDEYVASEDGYDANPLDLLPNQKSPYYDTLAQKIEGMNFETMPKEQFINTINNMPGIKKDEIEATELVEFVNNVDGNKISKQDLLTNWYDNSRVVLKTRLFGSDTGSGEMEEAYGRYEDYITPGDYDKYKEHLITFHRRESPDIQKEFELQKYTNESVNVEIIDGTWIARDVKSALVYDEGALFGRVTGPYIEQVKKFTGKLRSEIIEDPLYYQDIKNDIIKELNKDLLRQIKDTMGFDYKSSHFGPKDIIAHTRSTERVIDGQPTFFIEEVQSDMHQQGMKQGYRNTQEMVALRKKHEELLNNPKFSDDPQGNVDTLFKDELRKVSQQLDLYNARIPDAPFKNEKDWVSLSLKEMVYFAASKGYDKVAWTSGRLQNERYDIGNYADELQVNPGVNENEVVISATREVEGRSMSEEVFQNMVELEKLDETVGKPLADKIRNGMENAPDEFEKFGLKFSGLDLNLAGEGKTLQRFYDNLIPSLLKKMYEKDGVEFGKTSLITNVDAQPAPLEEMMDDLYNEAANKVVIVELRDDQIAQYNKTNEDFLEEQLVKKEGYEIYGVVRNDSSFLNRDNDMILDAKEFEIKDERQIEAPLEKLFEVDKGYQAVPPRLELAAGDRADDYFRDLEHETIMEIVDEDYMLYVDEFNSKQRNEDFVERNILYMTIPEGLKDRVLKLGQPLFGTNPSKLGAYENKTTQ